MVSEGLVFLLLVFRRESRRLSRRPMGLDHRLRGFFHSPARSPSDTDNRPGIPPVALQLAGTAFEIYAKVFLGISFGIVAADREIAFRSRIIEVGYQSHVFRADNFYIYSQQKARQSRSTPI